MPFFVDVTHYDVQGVEASAGHVDVTRYDADNFQQNEVM